MADEAVAEATKNYPHYRSHKVVQAAQIAHVGDPDVDGNRYIFFELGFPQILCPAPMFARYVPVPGDYLVVYRDNYMSFSPKVELEDGYAQF